MDARKSLEKRLGNFLGIDDEDAVDVLDQLLAIEGEDDLLDYISQLLGSRDEEIVEFVKDIGRFRQGLPLEGGQQQEEEETNKAEAAKPAPAPAPAKKNNQAKKTTQPQTKKAQPKAPPPAPAVAPKKAVVAVSPTKTTPEANTSKEAPEADDTPPIQQEAVPQEVQKPKKKLGPPPRGKTQGIICGCFGTLHRPLTNCLYCGRISCAEEGYDFCPYCGYLVEEVKPPEGGLLNKAWQHKERLLRYDRETAQRTVVLDDQADYYSNQMDSWLTEEEQANAEHKDGEQRSNIHQRKKQVLNIAF